MFSNISHFHDFKLVNFFDFVIFIEQLLRIVVFQMFDKIPIVYSTHSLNNCSNLYLSWITKRIFPVVIYIKVRWNNTRSNIKCKTL
jgi:hypothetical protein